MRTEGHLWRWVRTLILKCRESTLKDNDESRESRWMVAVPPLNVLVSSPSHGSVGVLSRKGEGGI